MDDTQPAYEPLGIWDPSLRQDFSEYLRRYAQITKPIVEKPAKRGLFGRKRRA